jgi:hypothetical protein
MARDASNVERLEAAGVIIKTPLPEEYESVIQELDDEEVGAIIRVKERLDKAQADAGMAYAEYFVPF